MSKDIENKVVSMEFDNSKFEKPAEQTMSTLDRLKAALKFKNVSEGFDAMQKGIKAVTFSPIEKGIDSVYAKFTFMERFTIQFYDRLANKIINTGRLIASEMFTRPISTGKAEYEEKMTAVQTIMASTNRSMADVNQTLAELNEYADQTIYSFSDMTNNIGKFTNAGVKLEDAVAAIKGISNEAALSGANANEASRAMYNFAQALSSGSVKLIDWKSIENANMATKEFKQELIDTAVAMGKLTKGTDGFYKTTQGKAFNATAKFNDALQDQWMTSEVLIKTLQKYSDTSTDIGKRATAAATEVKTFSMLIDTLKEALQSGWSESWEHIIGDFEEAKRLWTDVSGVLGGLIDRMADARNTMLKMWAQLGGRTAMLNSITNIWRSFTNILGAVRDAFRTVVPPMTGKRLADITKNFEAFTRKIVPSTTTINKIRDLFVGLFNVLGIGIDMVKAFIAAFSPLVNSLFRYLTTSLLKSSGGFKEWVINLRKAIKQGQIFERLFGGIADVLSFIGKVLKEVFGAIGRVVSAFNSGGMTAGFEAIRREFSNIFTYVIDLFKTTKPLEKLKSLGLDVAKAVSNWPIVKAFTGILKAIYGALKANPITGLIVDIFESLFRIIQAIIRKFASIDTSGIREGNKKIFGEFRIFEAIKNFLTKVFEGIKHLFQIVTPIFARLGKSLAGVIKSVFSVIRSILENSDLGDIGGFLAGGGIGALTYNLSELIKSFRKRKTSIHEIVKGFSTILANAGEAIASFSKLAKAKALKEIAVALAILAGSLLVISSIPKDKMADSMAAILELFAGLALTMKVLSTSQQGLVGSASMLSISTVLLSLAAAVAALSVAMAILSFISYNDAIKGIFVISSLFAVLSTTIKKVDASPKVIFSTMPILAMAAFMVAVSLALVPLAIISAFDENAIVTSVLAVSAIVLIMSLACKEIASSSKIGSIASAVPIISMAVLIAAVSLALAPLAIIGAIEEDAVKKAMLSLIAVISAVTLCIYAISKASGIRTVFSALPIVSMVTIILSVSAALFLLTLAAKIDSDSLELSMTALSIAILAVSGAYILISRTASSLSILRVAPFMLMATSLIAIATSLALLTLAMNSRAYGAEAAITSLIKCVALMTAVYLAISKFGSAKVVFKMAPILVLSNMLVLVAGALSLLTLATHGREDGARTAVVALTGVFAALAGMAFVISKIKMPSLYSIAKLATMAITITALMIPFVAMITSIGSLFSAAEKEGSGDAAAMLERFSVVLVALLAIPILFKRLINTWSVVQAVKLIGLGAGLKSIVSAVATATAAVEDLTAAKIGKFLLLGAGVAAIGAILSAVSGFRLVANGAKMFAIIVVSVTASLFLLTKALQSLSNSTFDFKKLEKNLRGIGTVLVECREDLAMGLAAIVSGIVEGVLASVYNSLETALTETLDMLLKVAPELFTKLAKLFVILAGVIEDQAPEIATAITRAIISIIHALANAIDENSTEIVMAVSRLLDALLKLVIKAVGKIFGVTKDELEGFANDLLPVVKPIAKIILGIFAVTQIQALASKVAWILGSFVGNVGRAISSIASFLTAHPVLVAMAAVATGLSSIFKAASKNIKVIEQEDRLASDIANRMRQREEAYQETLKRRQEAMDAADKDFSTYTDASKKLDEIVDKNGKLKTGYEAQFETLRNTLSAVAQIEIGEDGRVKIINDQNEALNYQKTTLDEILKKKQQQNRLDALSSEYNAALEKDRSGELKNQYAKAKEATDEYYGEMAANNFNFDILEGHFADATKGKVIEKYNEYKKLIASGESKISAGRKVLGIGSGMSGDYVKRAVDELVKAGSTFIGRFQQLQKEEQYFAEQVARNTSFILAYEDAVSKVAEGAKDADLALDKLASNPMFAKTLTDFSPGYRYSTLETQAEVAIGKYADALKYTPTMTDETRKRYVNQILATFDELEKAGYQNSKKLGDALDKGIRDGLSGNDLLRYMVKFMNDNVIDPSFRAVDSNSPSKVFAKLGKYCMLGLIQGVNSDTAKVNDTFDAAATASIAAYTAAMKAGVSSFAWTPLIDTTGIQNGTALLQSQMAGLQNTPLATTMTSKLAASVDTSSLDMDNSRILESMAYISEELGALKDVIANLQVVMDSGQLVGALAPGMDMELGRRTVRKERGV